MRDGRRGDYWIHHRGQSAMNHQKKRVLIDEVIDKRFDALEVSLKPRAHIADNREDSHVIIDDLDKLYYIRASLIEDEARLSAKAVG